MRGGLPHSEIPGSTIARISPGLIAACYVLHRLSVPRHPPDALHYALEHHTQRQRPDCIAAVHLVADAATSLEDTCSTCSGRLTSKPYGPSADLPDMSSSVMSHTRFFTQSISKPQRKCHHFGREKGTSCRVLTETPRCASPPEMVEVNGIEPMTSCLQSRRSPN